MLILSFFDRWRLGLLIKYISNLAGKWEKEGYFSTISRKMAANGRNSSFFGKAVS